MSTGSAAAVAPADIQIRGWGWRHGGRRDWALRGVDIDIGAGERVLLLGPSGAGKSTLLLAIAGLLDPEGGEGGGTITVGGADPRAARDRTGLVMQDPETQLVMARAGDDVAFGLENLAMPADRIWPRVDEALATVGFPYGRDRFTDQLSGGEQQRLVLAGAIARLPGVLLLDEPTANLDPAGAELIRGVVDDVVRATGATLLLVEHRVDRVTQLVDRVVVLEAGGGVVADGPPDRVFGEHGAALAERGVWVPGVPLPARRVSASVGAPVIGATDVTVTYPGAARPAVDRASAEVASGELVALTGPNGSGKSTLGLVLAGLLAPDDGGAYVRAAADGLPPSVARLRPTPLHEWPAARLADIVGTVFQDPEHQFLRRTVADELALGPRRAGLAEAAVGGRVDDLLERLFLTHLRSANPFTLSGGEKRRLSVATALASGVAGPRALILDEPTFGQDRRTWIELVDLLAGLRADGVAQLCLTHDGLFVDAVADKILTMRAGTLSASAAPAPAVPP